MRIQQVEEAADLIAGRKIVIARRLLVSDTVGNAIVDANDRLTAGACVTRGPNDDRGVPIEFEISHAELLRLIVAQQERIEARLTQLGVELPRE